jgi:hypothetical protein
MLAAQSGDYHSRIQPTPAAYDLTEITELLNSAQIDWNYYVTSAEASDPENGHAVVPNHHNAKCPACTPTGIRCQRSPTYKAIQSSATGSSVGQGSPYPQPLQAIVH